MRNPLAMFAFVMLYAFAPPSSIRADIFWVTNQNVVGPGRFADAVIAANAHAGPDTILFTNISGGIFEAGNLPPLSDVSIVGIASELASSRTNVPNLRVGSNPLFIPPDSTVNFTGLKFQGGTFNAYGGMISNAGTLRIDQCEFNRTTGSNNYGGAIYSIGRLEISRSSFYSNALFIYCPSFGQPSQQRVYGGAICVAGGSLGMTNCTLSYNRASTCALGGSGGAIGVLDGSAVLVNCTLAENEANIGAAVFGPITLINCILTGSTSFARGISNRIVGTQLIAADLAAAGLGPLTDNGGLTLTHALLTNSLAIEAGTDSGPPIVDQLGNVRPYGPRVDLGAVESVWPAGWSALFVSTSGSGFVQRTPNQIILPTGTVAMLKAVALEDNAFADWSGDASNSVDLLTVQITGNKSVTATFVDAPATVTNSPGDTNYVTNTNGWNPGSLRQAIRNVNASGGGAILFSNVSDMLFLTTALPPIARPTRIVGPGRNALTLVWGSDGPLFAIGSGITASVSRLTLQGLGWPYSGTAFSNSGSLTLRDVVIKDFRNGAVFSPGSLGVLSSTLTNNYGGGIASTGDLFMSSSIVTGSHGGRGVYATGPSTRIEYSSILDNEIRGRDGQSGCSPDIFNPYGIFCSITANATDGTGGGLHAEGGVVALTGCTIAGNRAFGGNAVGAGYPYPTSGAGSGLGGGVYVGSGVLAMTNCTVAGNYSIGGNGAGTSRNVTGGANAVGGLYTRTGNVLLVNCTISGNSATGGRGAVGGVFAFAVGGGSGVGGVGSSIPSSVQLLSSTVIGNMGVGGQGVFGFLLSKSTAGVGIGGVSVWRLFSHNSIIAGNIGSIPTTNSIFPTLYSNDAVGNIGSRGHNLIGTTNPLPIIYTTNYVTGFAEFDILNVDPRLGSLQDNGGPTFTHIPLAGSPAIDAGTNTGLTFDQRWHPRTCDGRRIPNSNGSDGTDIGAVEADQSMCYQFVTRAGNDIRITFTSDAGITYGLESKSEVSAPAWNPVPGNITGTGGLVTFTDSGAASRPRGFYRVFEWPP